MPRFQVLAVAKLSLAPMSTTTNDCYCKSEGGCINLIGHGSYARSDMTSAVLLAITPFAGTPNVAN
jgi:hypothetical protein